MCLKGRLVGMSFRILLGVSKKVERWACLERGEVGINLRRQVGRS